MRKGSGIRSSAAVQGLAETGPENRGVGFVLLIGGEVAPFGVGILFEERDAGDKVEEAEDKDGGQHDGELQA